MLKRLPALIFVGIGLLAGGVVARAAIVPTPLPLPSVTVPTLNPTLPSVLPTAQVPPVVPTAAVSPPAVATPLPSAAVVAPGATPVPAPGGPVTQPAQPARAQGSAGGGAAAATAPGASSTAPAAPVAAVPSLVETVLDSPLGPAPPIAGLVLLALSAGLALRRRLRQLERDRVLESAKIGFLKVASHELRTPLTVIGGYVAMAGDGTLGPLPERLRGVLPTLDSEVRQLERLVEQMLMAARVDERLLVLDERRLDLRAVVEDCLRQLPEAPAHRVVLETDTVPVPVQGDPARLCDVLSSLVDNAIKYSPAGGEVVVRVERRWGQARLSVRDSGVGIGAGDVPFLFTRFGRIVTPENSHIFGSGLGLYLVRELVRLHRGQVRVTSQVGKGSTFSVELPLQLPFWRRFLPLRRPARPASQAAG